MTTRTAIVSLLVLAFTCAPTMAQTLGGAGAAEGGSDSGRLAVGSKAPELSVEEFLKGKPVEGLQEGTAYVVEFWATWCGPCIKSIPHLTKLQKKHKNIVIIGVAGAERTGKEPLEAFIKKQGSKMAYTVAYDSDRSMSAAWMSAAGQNGIPCAFVVDTKGMISWIGNPHDKAFDAEVAKVAKGSKLPKSAKGGSKEDGEADDAAKTDDEPKGDDASKGGTGSDGAKTGD